MRRFGAPLMPMGMGMGMGSPLLTTLMAGGLGYALGSNAAQQAAPQAQQAPPYPYQTPQYHRTHTRPRLHPRKGKCPAQTVANLRS